VDFSVMPTSVGPLQLVLPGMSQAYRSRFVYIFGQLPGNATQKVITQVQIWAQMLVENSLK
jgi:hypothetical protein